MRIAEKALMCPNFCMQIFEAFKAAYDLSQSKSSNSGSEN